MAQRSTLHPGPWCPAALITSLNGDLDATMTQEEVGMQREGRVGEAGAQVLLKAQRSSGTCSSKPEAHT